MNTTSACFRCGRPVSSEDRHCSACGAPQTPTPSPGGSSGEPLPAAGRLLEALRAATVGEYEIRGEIGRGGMAAVYLAYDLRLNRKVAMKVMLPELAYHEGMEERFKREARTAAKLDHPNIVVIHSVRDDTELLYFVMKYIEGASLDQLVRVHASMPIPVVQYLLVQLAGALQYAHDEGVVHRDIKPGNVLIDLRGNVLVTDFGIAKATEAPHLTRTGSVIGTPTYMSPEQCLGSEQTHASDQYSLGVVAYELIAGRPPFIGSAVEKQWAHIKEEPEPLLSLRPDCPQELGAAVMRMLAKEASDRWPTLRQAAPALWTGLVPGDDTPRRTLADLVRFTTPGVTHDFAITPASPLPRGPGSPPKHVWTSIAIAPPEAALDVGKSLQLAATFAPPPADPRVATPTLTWSSSANHIVSVSDAGVATANAPGSVVIIAQAGALAAASSITARPARVAAIELSPQTASLEVGTSVVLQAAPRDATGGALADRPISWTSSNSNVASVSQTGLVTAHSLGSTTITATSESIAASATVGVVPDAVAELSIDPQVLSLTERTSERVVAAVRNRRGKPIVGRQVEWRSADPAIAAVGSDGVVTAKTAGRTTISATLDRRSATAQVVVRPADVATVSVTPTAPTITVGDSLVFAAEVRDRGGQVLPGHTVTWKSSNPATLAIDRNANATGVRAGVADVTAECGGVVASVRVMIAAPVVATLGIEASAASLRAGKRMRLRAKASDPAGREISAPNVTWRSSDAQIASVEGDGTLVALREGSVTVTAAVPYHEAHAVITITPPAAPLRVARPALIGAGVVAVGIAAFLLIPDEGSRAPSAVDPVDSPADSTRRRADSVVTVTPPANTTDTLATTQPPTPVAAETTQTPPPPAERTTVGTATPPTPTVDPSTVVAALRITSTNPLSVEVGDQSGVTLRATARNGNEVARPRVRWAAADASVISVTRDGVITGLAAGRTTVTATADGASARVDVEVRRPAPARVAITPRPSSLRVGQESRLGAEVVDRRGTQLGFQVTWRSSNAGIASVDNIGTVRALRAGEVTISATAGPVADSVRLAVAGEVVRADPVPAPVSPPAAPTPYPAAPSNAEAAAAAAKAAADAAVEAEVRAVAQAVGAAMPRGQPGPVTATGPFARFVRDNTPAVFGALRMGRRSVSDTTAEAVFTLPLRWTDYAGRVRNGSVDLLITLALRDGAWSRTSARNLNSP